MKEWKNTKHLGVTEVDFAKEYDLKTMVGEKDFLLDIKALISEYYIATFTAEGDSLKIAFNNGQSFKLTVSEIL